MVHLDNCRVYFSKCSQKFFEENSLLCLPQSFYSPDLVLSDFWIFGHIKGALQGFKFEGPDELLQGISDFLNHLH
jgi:hypothetical protein